MQTGQIGHVVSSSPGSPFDANVASVALLKQKQKHRQSHRSTSLSSGSAVTVLRPGSLSRVRSQSPGEEPSPSMSVRLSRDPMSLDHKRRKSLAIDPSEHYINDLAGPGAAVNSNRWSHSTASSISSNNKRRNRSSSGAILASVVGQSFSPRHKPTAALDASPRATTRHVASHPHSLTSSPDRSRKTAGTDGPPTSLTALPPLHTTPALTDPNDTDSPSTAQTLPTPSYHPSHHPPDGYFDGQNGYGLAKTKRIMMVRQSVAPMSAHNNNSRAPGLENQDTAPRHTESEQKPRSVGQEAGHSRRPRTRERVEKDKKTMLSKALQKANTAVLLDNAQNYEGALEAYGDACDLLTQVMERTSGEEDKRKLDAIRVTYSNRMEELRQLVHERPSTAEEKNLPARPMSDDSLSFTSPNGIPKSPIEPVPRDTYTEMPIAQATTDVPRLSYPRNDRDSFFERTMQAVENSASFTSDSLTEFTAAGAEDEQLEDTQPRRNSIHLPPPEHSQYIPRPLSPKRPPPPTPDQDSHPESAWLREPEHVTGGGSDFGESQANSTSWLDPIDESGSSCSDSVHSIDDLQGMRRKHIRGTSGATDPDFDAAFDAAVEAAYDEGFEPDLEARRKRMTAMRHNHSHNESIQIPHSAIDEISPRPFQRRDMVDLDLEEEEEERILDEFTQDYGQGFNFDLQTKSALPRQSDSSGYSRSTWQSSQLSDRATNATSLSTVAEDGLGNRILRPTTKNRGENGTILPPPLAPPPTIALPQPPGAVDSQASGVRSRRLSGMNPKQLKIETSPQPSIRNRASTFHHSASPFAEDEEDKHASESEGRSAVPMEPTPSDVHHDSILQSPPSLEFHSVLDEGPKHLDDASLGHRPSYEEVSADGRPTRPTLFRKNKSSISLRGHTEHTLLLASPDVDTAPQLFTPMSSTFMSFAAKRYQDPLHSQRANLPAFGPASFDGQQAGGGIYLFDTTLAASQPAMSPRSPSLSPLPTGLEPCPESFLLRPFWLMRALQQTISHPRGGFLTTKLFVQREVWQTRGAKLKLIEDKIANIDLLTAALGKLASTDTFDADAVMDELQSFEEVMERVQAVLSKKLGSDVGVHGVAGIFKDASAAAMATATGNAAPGSETSAPDKATKSNSGKSYLTSWRKLRNKSSGAPLSGGSHHAGGSAAKTPVEKDQHTMPSVPMTSFVPVERRGNKRDARNLVFEGPNKEYMGSLARLFDGVQVLDQIARQVEDPGLKHSSPTHVGLELSIRHAAEFFGFYVCRFVLADLGVLMDKFIKRGTEWVLA